MKPALFIWGAVSYQLGDAVAGVPQKGESRMAESSLGCNTVQYSAVYFCDLSSLVSSRRSSMVLVHDEPRYQNPCTMSLLLRLQKRGPPHHNVCAVTREMS